MPKSVYTGGTGEIEEKKSRFIAHIEPVTTEEDAVAFINAIKKQYFDARHNCSAFVIGDNSELTRCSDDGEPSGTAGRPMLEILLGEGITNVCCVVTRYFGGTLLGTGGLVRAYQGAVKEGLNNSVIIEKKPGILVNVTCEYTEVGKLQYNFANKGIRVLSSDYGTNVTFKLVIDLDSLEIVKKDLTEITSGKAIIEVLDKCMYADVNSEILIY
ncbi:MAG: YigZ family protein [Lachnospiraceae bacterium]|nr:YigZ family protein [Lachnospiraceae bacterium]